MDRYETADSDILKVVAHDLRNPLTCIESYAELLLADNVSGADRRKILSRILSCTRWASHIVNDLTDSEAVEQGKLTLSSQLLSLEAVVAEAVEDFRVLCEARGVALALKIEARGSQGMADGMRVRQVLSNLLVNALKHSASGGRIAVVMAETDAEVVVTVEDDGEGIDPNHLSRIFEKFYQAGKDGRGSLGLGLFISRSIVELHGGRIWAASDGLGRGAAFSFTLPKYLPDVAYDRYRAFRAQPTPPPRRMAREQAAAPATGLGRLWEALRRLLPGKTTPAVS